MATRTWIRRTMPSAGPESARARCTRPRSRCSARSRPSTACSQRRASRTWHDRSGEGRHAPALSVCGDMLAAVNVLVVAFAVLAGVAGSVQVAVMSKLGDRVGVFGALAWATTLAAILTLVLLHFVQRSPVGFVEAARAPVWMWSGAAMAVIIVLAITVAGSRIGVIATVSVLLAGQFAAGAAIDRWGLLGAERVGIGWWKVVGIVLLGIGAGLTLKK